MTNNLPPDFFANINKFRRDISKTMNQYNEIVKMMNTPSINLRQTIRDIYSIKPNINVIDYASLQRSIQPTLDAYNKIRMLLVNNQQSIKNVMAIANEYSNFVDYITEQYTEEDLNKMDLDEFYDILESEDTISAYYDYVQNKEDNILSNIIIAAHDDYIDTLNKMLFAELIPNPHLKTISQRLTESLNKVESNIVVQKIISYSDIIKRNICMHIFESTLEPHLQMGIVFIIITVIDIAIHELDNKKDTDD